MATTTRYRALVVDDEPDLLELLCLTLARMDIDTAEAADLAGAKSLLASEDFDLCLTDMNLPDGDGIELVRHIQATLPELPVAIITAHGNVERAVEALKAGAYDFVNKPVDLKALRGLVGHALKLSAKSHPVERHSRNQLLGESEPMRRLRAMIQKLARSQAPVYISGESGTGKELVARLIHEQGPRGEYPFVPVNCGAIPEELVESELFGHKKGSFTGATADHLGLFRSADGGTLFLDEIADLSLRMQVKLLRAIQEKVVRPVGGQREVPVDVRILCATHKNLAQLVEQGEFREDLFYRLNVIEIHVPSLRERREDIPLLANHILQKSAGFEHVQIDTDALAFLMKREFQGNVRELENVLQRAMTFREGDVISTEDLQDDQRTERNCIARDSEPTTKSNGLPLEALLEKVEKDRIQEALNETGQNKTAAAKLLGISFRQLRYRLKKLGLDG